MRKSNPKSAGSWRWRAGRWLKGLPPQRTWSERFRSNVLEGPGQLTAGNWTYWFPKSRFVTWRPEDRIAIGAFTSIASGVSLLCGGEHNVGRVTQYSLARMLEGKCAYDTGMAPGTITIGSDVWLATDAMALSSVTIGDGAVVAARSVVTRDVPPYAIAAGSPARVIRYRHSEDDITRLLALRWWNWPIEMIREAVPLLEGFDLAELEAFAAARGLVG